MPLSFVIGFPEEDREDIDQTLRLSLKAVVIGNNNFAIRFYPKTFMLLALELRASVSTLFVEWIRWLGDRRTLGDGDPSPRDRYLHFREIVRDRLEARPLVETAYLPDMLNYENCALDVGRFGRSEGASEIDLEGISKLTPTRSDEIIVESLEYDLPAIISDMKEDAFPRGFWAVTPAKAGVHNFFLFLDYGLSRK
jgi:hypothetical protein